MKLALIAAIILALVGPAAAGGRVDWSDYIDHDAKPSAPRATAESPAEQPASVRTKKAAKAKKAKKVAKSKASAKARKKKGRR